MTLFLTEIRELRSRFTVDPEPGDPATYTRELQWTGDAPNEHEARRAAMVAWGYKYGEDPELPLALDIRPAAE
ncbi:MAG: hypothetical protein ACRDLP_09935 [Solirubrobacteraceae bacterium]